MRPSDVLRSSVLGVVLCAAPLAMGCVVDPASEDTSMLGDDLTAQPHAFAIGMANEVNGYESFRAAAHVPASDPRLCHVYTYWNIARDDVNPNHGTGGRAGLLAFMAKAEAACDEVLVTFQGPGGSEVVTPPTGDEFEQAFVAFQDWTKPGQPLAAWAGKLSYTAWNEPNNPTPAGNSLNHDLTPEIAAEYYLRARKHCHPSQGCKVAAGDFATNGSWAKDIWRNCADDTSLGDTPSRCAKPSPFATAGAAPSYLDRYKNHIVRRATAVGLPPGFRPEVFGYHPWHDVNSYLDTNAACDTYQHCTTRRLLESLGGSWSQARIWDTEIGLGLQNSSPPNEHTKQPCAAAFLVRLTDLSPRVTRVYFMWFARGNGPLLDEEGTPAKAVLRPAGKILADGETSYGGAKCAPTGIAVSE